MTNAEAIKIINQYDCNFYWTDGEKIPTEDLIEAFELAVRALDAQIFGEDCPYVCERYERWKAEQKRETDDD